jgi:hypothetical protein
MTTNTNTKITCVCGSIHNKYGATRHKQTTKHMSFMAAERLAAVNVAVLVEEVRAEDTPIVVAKMANYYYDLPDEIIDVITEMNKFKPTKEVECFSEFQGRYLKNMLGCGMSFHALNDIDDYEDYDMIVETIQEEDHQEIRVFFDDGTGALGGKELVFEKKYYNPPPDVIGFVLMADMRLLLKEFRNDNTAGQYDKIGETEQTRLMVFTMECGAVFDVICDKDEEDYDYPSNIISIYKTGNKPTWEDEGRRVHKEFCEFDMMCFKDDGETLGFCKHEDYDEDDDALVGQYTIAKMDAYDRYVITIHDEDNLTTEDTIEVLYDEEQDIHSISLMCNLQHYQTEAHMGYMYEYMGQCLTDYTDDTFDIEDEDTFTVVIRP